MLSKYFEVHSINNKKMTWVYFLYQQINLFTYRTTTIQNEAPVKKRRSKIIK